MGKKQDGTGVPGLKITAALVDDLIEVTVTNLYTRRGVYELTLDAYGNTANPLHDATPVAHAPGEPIWTGLVPPQGAVVTRFEKPGPHENLFEVRVSSTTLQQLDGEGSMAAKLALRVPLADIPRKS